MRLRSASIRHTPVLLCLIIVLASGAVLAACGGTDQASTGTAASDMQLEITTTPADGAVESINWNLTYGEPTSVDPIKAMEFSPNTLTAQLYDTLLRYEPDWTLGPCIAESWKQPDPLTTVFTIRSDARFWDGNPVTVADVLYSMERHMDPKNGSYWVDYYKNVDSIKQTGPQDITVKFKRADELFVKEMGTCAGAIVEKAYVEKVGNKKYGSGTKVMGSGPYKLVSWTPGTSIVVEANKDYWDSALAPRVSQITFTFLTDPSTVTSAILSGQIDVAYDIPATSLDALNAVTQGKLYFGPSINSIECDACQPDGLMADPDIRNALSMAIDRESIAQGVYKGMAEPTKSFAPPPSFDPEASAVYQASYDELPDLAQDIAGAKKLLDGKSGLDTPIVLAHLAGDERDLRTASIIQQAAKDIGLTIQLKPLQPLDLLNAFYVPEYRKGMDILLTGAWLTIPDPLDALAMKVLPEGIVNWVEYENPEVTELVVAALGELDPDKRAQMACDAIALVMPDKPYIPLVCPYMSVYMSNRISGLPLTYTYFLAPSAAMLGGTK